MQLKSEELIGNLGENELFEDPDFEYFSKPLSEDMEIDLVDFDTHIRWLRPNEIVSNPLLGKSNIKPDEVKQGNLGDCWFIAALGTVARYPQLYDKILPDKNVANYQGYLKVCFWLYGEWIEIYIDDKLPTRYNKSYLWSVYNADTFLGTTD